MGKEHVHHVDPNLVKRLRRATGHLESVTKMVEDKRSCTEVLQQLSAVIAALNGSRVLLLKTHFNNCLKPVLPAQHAGLVDELEQVLQQAMKG
jgi:CsoR family transcriptional regulator, copper-sensing transcriptional repressor